MTLNIHRTHLFSHFHHIFSWLNSLVVCLSAISLPTFCIPLAEIAPKVNFLFMLSDLINTKMNYLSNNCNIYYEQSFFFLSLSRKKRETIKWPPAWLKARDGRGTKKERLPPKPERMVFHGLVIFRRKNWNLINRIQYCKKVDRPSTQNVTLEFAWTPEVFAGVSLLFFLTYKLCSA